MPLPEHYDDWDPEAHDIEAERLEAVELALHYDDLRSLKSEVVTEQHWAKTKSKLRTGGQERRALQDAFEAAHPPPSRDEPDARAEWKWRLEEHILAGSNNVPALHRHRLERGAYIERYRRIYQDSLDRQAASRAKYAALPPPPTERPPWPVGDGVSEQRRINREEYGDEHPPDALAQPWYDAALNLGAGVGAWFQSLDPDNSPGAGAILAAGIHVSNDLEFNYTPEHRPGTIGKTLSGVRKAIVQADALLDLLAAHRHDPVAHRRRLRPPPRAHRGRSHGRRPALRRSPGALRRLPRARHPHPGPRGRRRPVAPPRRRGEDHRGYEQGTAGLTARRRSSGSRSSSRGRPGRARWSGTDTPPR